jgi:hypothetical protein
MEIVKNAGRVLLLVYRMYVKKKRLNPEKLLELIDISPCEADLAVKYLRDEGLIDIILTFGNHNGLQHFILKKITPKGINIVEENEEFMNKFKINPKSIKFEGY